MRVTKVIREYIEEKVAEKLPFPEKPKNSLIEDFEQLEEKMNKVVKEEFKALALKYKGQFCYSWTGDSYDDIEVQLNYIDKNVDINGCVCRIYTKADTEYKKELERVKKQRADIVKDIIVTLELGGTKAELEEMLAKVGA